MKHFGKVIGALPFKECALDVRLDTEQEDQADLQGHAMLMLRTGAATISTYPSADELRALAKAFIEAADRAEALMRETT